MQLTKIEAERIDTFYVGLFSDGYPSDPPRYCQEFKLLSEAVAFINGLQQEQTTTWKLFVWIYDEAFPVYLV